MDMHATPPHSQWGLDIQASSPTHLVLKLSGDWCTESHLPPLSQIINAIDKHPQTTELSVNIDNLDDYNSGMIVWLLKVEKLCLSRKIALDTQALPTGMQRLIRLSKEVPPRGFVHIEEDKSLIGRTGNATARIWRRAWQLIDLIGAAVHGSGRFILGRSIFLKRDILLFFQDNGPDALAVVGVIAFLIGVTIAVISDVQLAKFGTQILIADIEVVANLREVGPLMAGILMAGRTSSAYAAEIGSMKADDEIDALHSLAISSIDFLVMPRIIATVIAMPLLVIYADVIANFGGLLFTTTLLNITYLQYITEAREIFMLGDFLVGIFKGFIFGYLIAIAGCLRGLQCGRSAAAVGNAATSAVVLAIVLIMICNTLLDIMFYALKV